MSSKFYITTTLPYVNAEPHIGFALEIVQADIIARHHYDFLKEDVFFNTGTDEHGLKIYKKAIEERKNLQDYIDEHAAVYQTLTKKLNIDQRTLNFIRTTAPSHIKAAQEIWRRCVAQGDIYKKEYSGLYCVNDEMFVKESEMVNGKCPNHPTVELIEIKENNYFFRLGKYEDNLLTYLSKEGVIVPEWRRQEAINFVNSGLEDISISRVKEKMPWGIPVPDDDSQVMYVWFDALTNYISTLGWPDDTEGKFDAFWTKGQTLQLGGKDQVRFQSIMWQAMLMSAGIKTTDTVMYHGFITSNGQKMSKSIGNVVNAFEVIEKYGADALRYWLVSEVNTFDDGDFTWEKFRESYNANLADNLGNLTNRIMKMVVSYNVPIISENFAKEISKKPSFLDNYDIHNEIGGIFKNLDSLNSDIETKKPFKKIETKPEEAKEDIQIIVNNFYYNVVRLVPFLPATAEKILECIRERKIPDKPLFPRK